MRTQFCAEFYDQPALTWTAASGWDLSAAPPMEEYLNILFNSFGSLDEL